MDSPKNTDPAALIDSSSIEDYWRELQEQQEEWDSFLERSFNELEEHGAQLVKHQQEIDEQRAELARERAENQTERESQDSEDIALEEHNRCVAAVEEELKSVREELTTLHEAEIGHAAANDVALEREVDQLTTERELLSSQLTTSQQRVSQLESSLEALAQSQAAYAASDGEGLAERSEEDAQLVEQLAQMLGDQKELEQELENVRSNASQLSNALEKSKRQIAEERAEWSVELKQMRVILQQQADMFQTYASNPTVPTTTIVTNQDVPQGGAPADGNQVVGSVMAQFEKIRQQRAKRSNRKSGGSQNDCA